MDINKEQTIETLPGFYPLTVVEDKTGYFCNVLVGDHVIGMIDEGTANNFRVRIDKAYTTQSGRFFTSDDFNTRDAAVKWIRDKWVAFVNDIAEPVPFEKIIEQVDRLIEQMKTAVNSKAQTSTACRIRCPQCQLVQDARVEMFKGDPFCTYVHHCTQCKYIITESEWNEVTPGDEILNGNGDQSQPGGVMNNSKNHQ